MTSSHHRTTDERRLALGDAPCPCRSGRLTRECHEALLRPPSEEEFYAPIERGLELVPNLRRVIPEGFPRSGRAKLHFEQAMRFEEIRTERYAHHINLPLVLHLAGNEAAVPGSRVLALHLLRILEAFAERFHERLGAERVLEPLWQQAWDVDDPTFWSVLSSCYWACRRPEHVIGFELMTGKDGKSADLVLHTPQGRVFVEIELWHQPPACSAADFGTALRRRFQAKAEKKFPTFTSPDFGVIVQVAFVDEQGLQMLREHRELLEPVDFDVESRWVGQLIAVAEALDASGSVRAPAFIDFNASIQPPPPS